MRIVALVHFLHLKIHHDQRNSCVLTTIFCDKFEIGQCDLCRNCVKKKIDLRSRRFAEFSLFSFMRSAYLMRSSYTISLKQCSTVLLLSFVIVQYWHFIEA